MDKIIAGLKGIPEVLGVGLFLIGFQIGLIEVVVIGIWLITVGAIIRRRTLAEGIYTINLQFSASYLLALLQLIAIKTPITELAGMLLITTIMIAFIPCAGLFLVTNDKVQSK